MSVSGLYGDAYRVATNNGNEMEHKSNIYLGLRSCIGGLYCRV